MDADSARQGAGYPRTSAKDGASPAGHTALCWDTANDQLVGAGALHYVCPDCGAAIDFNV